MKHFIRSLAGDVLNAAALHGHFEIRSRPRGQDIGNDSVIKHIVIVALNQGKQIRALSDVTDSLIEQSKVISQTKETQTSNNRSESADKTYRRSNANRAIFKFSKKNAGV